MVGRQENQSRIRSASGASRDSEQVGRGRQRYQWQRHGVVRGEGARFTCTPKATTRRLPPAPWGRVNLLVGTGIAGELSTFSSFAYRAVVLMSAFAASAMVASVYVVSSLLLGYIAVIVGLWLARNKAQREPLLR